MATFLQMAEGSRGTLLLKSGFPIPAMRVEVESVGEDYLLVGEWDAPESEGPYLVPMSSVLWFKYAGEDD